MGKSWSSTIMQDQRIAVEEAEFIAGVGAVVSLPSSVAIAEGAEVGDITIKQYTPEVQQTVGKLIESVDIVSQKTIPTLFESFNLVTKGLVQSFGDVITETAGTFGQSLETISESQSESLEAVSRTTGQSLERVREASRQASEASHQASELLGRKLQETQLGQAAILPGMSKYLLIAVVVIIVAGKVWK